MPLSTVSHHGSAGSVGKQQEGEYIPGRFHRIVGYLDVRLLESTK